MVNRFAHWIFILCLALLHTSVFAKATASLDRNPIELGETVQLRLSIEGEAFADTPDLSALNEYFDVRSTQQSSQMQIINGDYSRKNEWVVTLTAKKIGEFTIPPINIEGSSTKPIRVIIKEPSETPSNVGDDVFFNVQLDKKSAYVDAQILYTLRLYVRADWALKMGGFSQPNAQDAQIQSLGEARQYNKTVNGKAYQILEQRYAVFPSKAGTLKILPAILEGSVRSGRSRFDMFGSGKQIRLKGSTETIDVLAKPDSYPNQWWLPASEVRLEDSWSATTDTIKAGEPITRTLTLYGMSVRSSQLPDLPNVSAENARVYPDQAQQSDGIGSPGIVSVRQQKFAIIPTQNGELTLPEVKLPWWDTQAEQVRYATLPAKTFRVEGAVATLPADQPAVPNAQLSRSTSVEPNGVGAQDSSLAENSASTHIWPHISWGLIWLVTIGAWMYERRHRKTIPSERPHMPTNPKSALRAVDTACKQNDALATRRALLNWLSSHAPEQTPTLDHVRSMCKSPVSHSAIEQLNAHLYGNETEAPWRGESLRQNVIPELQLLEKPVKFSRPLSDLYKNATG